MSATPDQPAVAGLAEQPTMADLNHNAPKKAQPARRRIPRITRPDPGSLYDIMHDHAGTSLFILPICWTDTHAKLLGASFSALPAVVTPVPEVVPGRWLEPSNMARSLTSELHVLVKSDTQATRVFCKNRAMKFVLASLFPNTLSRPKTGADLDLYFGTRIFRKAVRIPCMWKTPNCADASFDSAPTLPASSFDPVLNRHREPLAEYAPNRPMLAYINRSQLAAIRQNLFRVVHGPDGAPNDAVLRLQRLRSKMLIPADIEHDPYIVSILLAMAQAHFYRKPSSKSSSQSSSSSRSSVRMRLPEFRDVKVQIITHDEGNDSNPNFVVYTAVVTPAFLKRFLRPEKAPTSEDGTLADSGLKITYTPVTFWPILGLKERLSKALGREIAGDPLFADPEYIGLWDPLLDQSKPTFPSVTTIKRRRKPLLEVLNSSFEEEIPSSSDDQPVLSPAAKRRRTARTVNPLEVC